MAVNIGSLNKRITFLQYGNTTNDEGFEIDGWTEVATVWAAVKTLQGREYIAADYDSGREDDPFYHSVLKADEFVAQQ
nr:phage head closure protein [Bacillus subtilis]